MNILNISKILDGPAHLSVKIFESVNSSKNSSDQEENWYNLIWLWVVIAVVIILLCVGIKVAIYYLLKNRQRQRDRDLALY